MADDLLIAMIIAGFALSGAYFRAVFILRLRNQAAEQERKIIQRELFAHRLCRHENELLGSSTVEIEKRGNRVPQVQPEPLKQVV